jgi:hypothetical protein
VSGALRRYPLVAVLKLGAAWATLPIWKQYFRIAPKYFELEERRLAYFFHNYNITWSNERALEIPAALDLLARYRGARILEVGNVLSHYVPVQHVIIDKFDRSPGLLNLDVADFALNTSFDLILSISTLEHVGWDEKPRDPGKIERALANLKRHLASGGVIFVTLPLGYNQDLDQGLRSGSIAFDRAHVFKRAAGNWGWSEVSLASEERWFYAKDWPGATFVLFGYFQG